MNTAIWIVVLVLVGVMLYSRFGGKVTLPGLTKIDFRLAGFGGAALAAFYVVYRVHGMASQEVPGYERTVREWAGYLLEDPILALSLLFLLGFVVSKWRSRKGGPMAVQPGAASAKDEDDTIGGMPKQEWAFWMTRAPERVAYSYRMQTVRWIALGLAILAALPLVLGWLELVPKEIASFLTKGTVVSVSGILCAVAAGLLLSHVEDTSFFGVLTFAGLLVLGYFSQTLWGEFFKKDPIGTVDLPWPLVVFGVIAGVTPLLATERFAAVFALIAFFILSLAPNF